MHIRSCLPQPGQPTGRKSGQPYELGRLLLPGIDRLFTRDALDERMRRYNEANKAQGEMSPEERRYAAPHMIVDQSGNRYRLPGLSRI